jgi:hypothetical protein
LFVCVCACRYVSTLSLFAWGNHWPHQSGYCPLHHLLP